MVLHGASLSYSRPERPAPVFFAGPGNRMFINCIKAIDQTIVYQGMNIAEQIQDARSGNAAAQKYRRDYLDAKLIVSQEHGKYKKI